MNPVRAAAVLSPPLKKTLVVLTALGTVALSVNFAFDRTAAAPVEDSARELAVNEIDSSPNEGAKKIASSEPAGLSDSELERARSVAATFAEAFATYSWDESREAAINRVAQWTSPALLEEFESDSGASYLKSERERTHERAIAKVEHVQTIGSTPTSAEFLVVLVIDTSNDSGQTTERSTINVHLTLTDGRWLVSEIG